MSTCVTPVTEKRQAEMVNVYQCHKCQHQFKSELMVMECSRCNSGFIEITGTEEKGKKDTGYFSYFKSMVGGGISTFFDVASEVASDSVDLVKTVGREFKPTINRTLSELASVKDIVVFQSHRQEDGVNHLEEVKVADIFRPLMINFGLLDKSNPNFPANEEDLKKLVEVDLTEDDSVVNLDSMQKERPCCSI